uniref:Uncharacterized protein n=1 Tax=Plectus sambesii TaxID=2011161 RepID=A0A914W9V5_9BILA
MSVATGWMGLRNTRARLPELKAPNGAKRQPAKDQGRAKRPKATGATNSRIDRMQRMHHRQRRIFLRRPQTVGRLPSATQLLTPRLPIAADAKSDFFPAAPSTKEPMIARLQFYHEVLMPATRRNIGRRRAADQVASGVATKTTRILNLIVTS